LGKSWQHIRPLTTLFAGTSISAVITLLTAPITTRLYGPDDYGRLGIVMVIANVCALPYVAGFSRSLLIASSGDAARRQYIDLIAFLPFVFLGTLIVVVLTSMFDPQTATLLFFSSIALTSISAISVATSLMIHSGLYRGLSELGISQSIATAGFSIGLGFAGFGGYGIIIGYVLGQLVSLALVWRFLPAFQLKAGLPWKPLVIMFKDKPRLFLASLPAEALNTFTRSLPVVMFSAFASAAAVGFFNVALRLLEVPAGFFTSAFTQYFQSLAIERHNKGKSLLPVILIFSGSLFSLGLPILILIIPILPDIAAWALGSEWREAGNFSQYLVTFIFLRIVVSPVTITIFLHKAFMISLWMDIALFIFVFLGLYFALVIHNNVNFSVLTFSVIYSVGYIVSFLLSLYYGRKDPKF
jgi:lipopolysaccharide exporter